MQGSDTYRMVTLSNSEASKADRLAWLAGMSTSAFIREALNEKFDRIRNEEIRLYDKHSGPFGITKKTNPVMDVCLNK